VRVGTKQVEKQGNSENVVKWGRNDERKGMK
jgi:hypothetical protein